MFKKRMKRITPGQMIILSFATMIFIGACLLMLPFSTNDGKGAPFLDALFTSTSASCVTGLIMHDTAQYWSPFGQLIILILIQIGGMGVIHDWPFYSLFLEARKLVLNKDILCNNLFLPQN